MAKIKKIDKGKVSKGIFYLTDISNMYKDIQTRIFTANHSILKTGNNQNVLQLETDRINYQITRISWINFILVFLYYIFIPGLVSSFTW